jgi:hypothetical protein
MAKKTYPKPLEISDPKEFAYRNKMYADSLTLYNQGLSDKKWLSLQTPVKRYPDGEHLYKGTEWNKYLKKPSKNSDNAWDRLKKANKKTPGGKQTHFSVTDIVNGKDDLNPIMSTHTYYTNFKKPKQPVVFKEVVENQTAPIVQETVTPAKVVEPVVQPKPTTPSKITAYKSQTVMYPDGSYELRQVPYYTGNDKGTWTQGTKLNPPGVINAADLSPEEISLLKNKNKLQPTLTTNQQFLDGGPLVDKTNHGKLLNSVYASALGNYYANGGMLKRADGSYSQRGLWDNIRANKGSGKKPTKEMLAQEKKINKEYANGGQFTKPYSLPEDSFKQGGNNLHNSVYASSMEQYPAPYEYGGPMSRFYASNVEEPATIGKDLAYNKGGTMNPIHINPENKGKFNATKARTGKTTEELTHSSNPLTRKRAIFAQNASRWNHQYGGYMFAEGGNLDPLTTFDEGGKHSENPLGGIPQGQNAQGGMNLVEEGETKLNSKDYIFSDTLKVDKDTVAEFNLPKTMVGKTFADASKKMDRPDSRRINDSIEEKAKERDLNALMEAQEIFKEKEVAKKMEEIQSLNPGLFEQMQQAQMAQMQPQGQPSPEQMMMQQGQAPMDPNAQPQMDPAMMEQMAMQQQGIPQQYGGQMYYQYGGQMYDFGGKLGEGIKNYGLGIADTTMSYLGMNNVIKDDQYEGFGADAAKGYAKVVGGIGAKVLPMAANMVVPGSGAVISGAQQLGSQVNPQQEQEQIAQMGGMNFKYGGTFDMPRQQMYMPLDHVTEMGGELSIEDQGLQNLENDYRNSIFDKGGFTNTELQNSAENQQLLAAQEAEPMMYPPDATQYPQGLTYAQANSAIAPGLQDSEMEVAQKMLRDAGTEEEYAKAMQAYKSAVARHDESLKNRNIDLTMNQTPMQAIGSALPIGYNIGMGLFGKPQQLSASDYMQKADIKAPEMNINPQLRATDQSFAQAANAGRNAGAGSEYLAYMSNLNNMRNKGYADLYGQKFNVDSQNAMNAQLQNKAIEGQNLQTKMGIVDYNAKAKAAKNAMLQEGFKQAATLADNSKNMDAQLALMKAIAPDFAGDMKYNTIFDQYKNRTKKQ